MAGYEAVDCPRCASRRWWVCMGMFVCERCGKRWRQGIREEVEASG